MKSFLVTAITAVIVFGFFTWLRHWMDDQVRELDTRTPLAVSTSAGSPSQTTPSSDYFAFCYFVYAPMFDVGRDHNHLGLLLFAEPRIAIIGGYFKAINADPASKGLSPKNAEQYQKNGKLVEQKLLKALKTNDPVPFSEALSSALWCDGKLGIETKWIPVVRRPGIPQ